MSEQDQPRALGGTQQKCYACGGVTFWWARERGGDIIALECTACHTTHGIAVFPKDLARDMTHGDLTKRELAWLIDGLMVLMHQMKQVPENDLSEMPELQALLERLMTPVPAGNG